MKYLITLNPLEPFIFGGDNTFGKLGDEDEGTYLVKSRQFPQQSAILGMLRKEMMIHSNLLTRKVRGEWVDGYNKQNAKELVGVDKFDIKKQTIQDYGKLKEISPIFLMGSDKNKFIKKVDIDNYEYKDNLLVRYNPKEDIYDNYVSIDNTKKLKSADIFKPIEQTGNKKGGEDNSLFKKTSFILKENFKFAFYITCDYKLTNSIVTLGADRSSFKMSVEKSNDALEYQDKKDYLTLLSDALITLPIKEHCDFAITSEISFRNLQNKKHVTKHSKFEKSDTIYLYEKGSVFINPTDELIKNLNNKNCQQIGYNKHTHEKGQN